VIAIPKPDLERSGPEPDLVYLPHPSRRQTFYLDAVSARGREWMDREGLCPLRGEMMSGDELQEAVSIALDDGLYIVGEDRS